MKFNYKVLHFDIAFYPKKSGSFYRLYNLVKHAKELEHIIITNTLEGPNSYDGITLIRIKRNLLNLYKYYRCYFNSKPDVLFMHNSIISIYLLPLLLLSKKYKIIEIHAIRKTGVLYNFINKIIYKYAFDKISVLSKSMKYYLINKYDIDENKIAVIYNGYDSVNVNKVKKISSADDCSESRKRHAAYIGSLHDWQGIPDLLNAAKKIKNVSKKNIFIDIYGGGPLSSYTSRYIKDNKLDEYVKCHGEIKKENIIQEIKNIDLLLIPRPSSISTETIVPLKILEYISYNKPIVMSDVGGLTEVLDANTECVTFKAGDSNDLAKKIIDLINNDSLMERLSKSALEKLKSYKNWNEQGLIYEGMILNGIR